MKKGRSGIWALAAIWLTIGTAAAEPLTVATMNVRWYGLGGAKEKTPADEYRDADLRRFVHGELGMADVIAFQEIVDVDRFRSQVVGPAFKCMSYRHPEPKHQHVVLCYRRRFTLERERGDQNHAIEEVALGSHRPAVYGILKDHTGRRLAHLLAVHLKAMPEQTQVRLRQADILTQTIRHFDDDLPVVLMGDFNTHVATMYDHDDAALIEQRLNKVGLRERSSAARFTYRTSRFGGKFDRIWATSGLRTLSDVWVGRGCNDDADVRAYNRLISDHCPVGVTFDVP